MPKTKVVLFRTEKGEVPILDWLDGLDEKPRAKCLVRLERLEAEGHALRRPEADVLRDGIYELRAAHSGINYRMLYFFHGRQAVVVSHGIIKQRADVTSKEIDLAIKRKEAFTKDPDAHTHEE